jgi:tetratricopeptide (TPR) repeat protein
MNDGSKFRLPCLDTLGSLLRRRYIKTGIIDDINRAIEIMKKAAESTPSTHPDLRKRLFNLAESLTDRFMKTRILDDISEAIQLSRRITSLTPDTSLDLPVYLSNLAYQLNQRHNLVGAMTDLEEAIKLRRQSIRLMPKSKPDYAATLSNLGMNLYHKYQWTQDINTLEESMKVAKEAVVFPQNDTVRKATFLSNLATIQKTWALEKEDMGLLDEAVLTAQQSITSTPDGSTSHHQALHMNNFGVILGDRASRATEAGNFDEAIKATKQAIALTPEDHPGRAELFNNLGRLIIDQYRVTSRIADIEEAVSYFKLALHQDNAIMIHRIHAGRAMLDYSLDRHQAYEAATLAVSLIPQLIHLSLEHSDMQRIIGPVLDFASDSASHALRVGKAPSVALSILEQGRGIIATSIGEVRMDVAELKEKQPELAERYVSLRDELNTCQSPPAAAGFANSTWQDETKRRFEIGQELGKVLDDIRSHGGSKDFLLLPSENEMYDAASKGPIVVINISKFGCNALIIVPDGVRALALDQLSIQDIERFASQREFGSIRVLEWL